MKPKPWVVLVALLVLSGGYVGYKLYVIGLAMGVISHTAPAKAEARVDFGPYPLVLEPQDNDAYWYNPAKVTKQVAKANARPRKLAEKALEDAGKDTGKALAALVDRRKEPDAAQAVLEAMRELAQGNEGSSIGPEGEKPEKGRQQKLFQVTPGESGIAHVARLAERLGAAIGTKDESRFDGMLLEDSIRLMGHYGAEKTSEDRQVSLADGSGKVAPIDPVVRGVLRQFMAGKGFTQALASRALGQLGDMETAKDLIEHPKRYEAASISDFGPQAVEQYKQQRMKLLKEGRGGDDAAFWQGVRLGYRDREVAFDLSMAGDGGAALAVERNLALEAAYAKDPDVRLAQYLDTMLRFPKTREALKARSAISDPVSGLWSYIRNTPLPKTQQMVLKVLDREFPIIFGEKEWKISDVSRLNSLCLELFYAKNNIPHEYTTGYITNYDYNDKDLKLPEFYDALERLYRRHYKSKAGPGGEGYLEAIWNLSLFARGIGLPLIDYPGRKNFRQDSVRGAGGRKNFGPPELIKAGILDGTGLDY